MATLGVCDPITPPEELLRDVIINGSSGHYWLKLWEVGCPTCRAGVERARLGYAFGIEGAMDGDKPAVLFAGEDFHCSPFIAIDSDAALLSLLSFLTLRPGDTYSDYFAKYDGAQMRWAESSECESLACDVAIVEDALEESGEPRGPEYVNFFQDRE